MKKILCLLFTGLILTLNSCNVSISNFSSEPKDGEYKHYEIYTLNKDDFKYQYDIKYKQYNDNSYPITLKEEPRNLDLPVIYYFKSFGPSLTLRWFTYSITYYVYDEKLGNCQSAIDENFSYSFKVEMEYATPGLPLMSYSQFNSLRYNEKSDGSIVDNYKFEKSNKVQNLYYLSRRLEGDNSLLFLTISFTTDLEITEEYAQKFEDRYLTDF